jgi:hypothetical protein
MNNGDEGRVWTLVADFIVLLAVAVIVGTFWLVSAGGFIEPKTRHSGPTSMTRGQPRASSR